MCLGRAQDDASFVQMSRRQRILRHSDLLETDLGLPGGRKPPQGDVPQRHEVSMNGLKSSHDFDLTIYLVDVTAFGIAIL